MHRILFKFYAFKPFQFLVYMNLSPQKLCCLIKFIMILYLLPICYSNHLHNFCCHCCSSQTAAATFIWKLISSFLWTYTFSWFYWLREEIEISSNYDSQIWLILISQHVLTLFPFQIANINYMFFNFKFLWAIPTHF